MWLILVLAPLWLYCIAVVRNTRWETDKGFAVRLAAFSACSLATLATFVLLSTNAQWKHSLQLAWTGLEADRPEAPLRVGGSKQEATIGWPTGFFAPELEIRNVEGRRFRLIVRGGAGFLRAGSRPLNGRPIPEGGELESGEFRVRWTPFRVLRRQMQVVNRAGQVVAEFPLPAAKDRAVPLSSAVTQGAVELRRQGRGKEARQLELWAARRWVLARAREAWWKAILRWITWGKYKPGISAANLPRLLVDSDVDEQEVDGRELLSVLWAHRSQYFRLRIADGRVAVDWQAPWTHSSPPPPESDKRPVSLHVCARPLPGDYAFTMPLGSELAELRRRLFFFKGQFVQQAARAVPELSQYAHGPQGREERQRAGVKSEVAVEAGPFLLRLSSLSDMPDSLAVLGVLILGLLLLGVAFRLHLTALQGSAAYTVCGIAAAFWTFLLIRFALAMRYALDPGALDSLAASGVESAAVALAVMPGLLLLFAVGLRTSQAEELDERWQKARRVLFHSIALAAGVYLASWLVRHYWLNAPDWFFPAHSFCWSWAGLLSAAVLLLAQALFATIHFQILPARSRILDWIAVLLALPLVFFERVLPGASERVWRTTIVNREPGVHRPPEEIERTRSFRLGLIVLALFLLAVYGLLFLAVGVLPPSLKLFQEIVVPVGLFWIPAGLLLGSRCVWRPEGPQGEGRPGGPWDRLALWRVALITGFIYAALFFMPLAIRDAGALVAAVSVFLAATAVVAAGWRPLSVAVLPLLFLAATLVLAGTIYLHLDPLVPTPGAIGESRPRLLVLRDSEELKAGLAWFSLLEDERSGVVSARKISNALEHAWENQAIAHEGSWWGLGFGNAPARRSLVPQDVIQSDSTYSFYIVAEHGLMGGLVLVASYLIPLALVLWGGRRLFGLGGALAAAISGAFFLEAVFHALMNAGVLPFTGRNLPLLSVNSGSNLWHWTVLLALTAQSILWQGDGKSVLLPRTISPREQVRRWRRAVLVIVAMPLLALVCLAVRGVMIAAGHSLASVFDWTPLLAEVNAMARSGAIKYDPATHTIQFRKPPGMTGTTLIEQEVERFNALSDEEKLEGLLAHHPKGFLEELANIRSLDGWDRLLGRLRAQDQGTGRSLRPSLFSLVRREAAAEAEADNESGPPVNEPSVSAHGVGSDPLRPDLDEPLEVRGNREYNTRITFASTPGPAEMPILRWPRARSGSWLLRGDSFEISLTLDGATRPRPVVLEQQDGSWHAAEAGGPDSKSVQLALRTIKHQTQRPEVQMLGLFEAEDDQLKFVPGVEGWRKLESLLPWKGWLKPGEVTHLRSGERVGVVEPRSGRRLDIFVASGASGALIGPAWVRGQWLCVFDPDPNIPWTGYLAQALPAEFRRLGRTLAAERYGSITLNPVLQAAAQRFAAEKGRQLHAARIGGGYRNPHLRLPPRVALAMVRLPGGEVVALGGWPRMSSDYCWQRDKGTGEWIPPLAWIEQHAPLSLRARYGGDRNFDRMLMGSATKPLWAAIVLGIHPQLARHFAVTGGTGLENTVFGIRLPGKAWEVPNSRGLSEQQGWCDFNSYLARSDNRYQVRLGFLGLAEGDGSGLPAAVQEDRSPSSLESMTAGHHPWGRYPRFPLDLHFNHKNPGVMAHLGETLLAERWWRVFGVGVRSGQMWYKTSFWTGDESDDRRPRDPRGRPMLGGGPTALLDPISPQAADLGFDQVTHPRQYVTLLLGGGSNMWSNVEFAAAFATAVTGQLVLPHMTPASVRSAPDRTAPTDEAKLVRPALTAVLAHPGGTAYVAFQQALPILRRLGEVYGKTGTLRVSENIEPTSRMALAVVRWDRSRTVVQDGLVFSLVTERGGPGTAAKWLAEFVVRNERVIRQALHK